MSSGKLKEMIWEIYNLYRHTLNKNIVFFTIKAKNATKVEKPRGG
jgi:hypothetical protein